MRELSDSEVRAVDGGVAPLIGAAIAVYSHFTASSVAGAILGRVGLALGVYGVGEYLSDS